MTVAARVRRAVRQQLPSGARVIVAVSGGSDSVALVHLLLEVQAEGRQPEGPLADAGLVLVGLAHLNHQLRGAASDADEAFCRRMADALGLPIASESADVAAAARRDRMSIERAGHRLRYAFYRRAAETLGATAVALGHTRDDQAETVLLRLVRGAGPDGLSGIHPRVGMVVRPLLAIGRDELRRYLVDRGVAYREDASNADVSVPRNRVRHELLPLLRNRFSPRIVETVGREAEIARADAEYLDHAARQALSEVSRPVSGGTALDASRLAGLPLALGRRVIRLVAPDLGFDAVESVLSLASAAGGESGRLDVAGLRVERQGPVLQLTSRVGRGNGPQAASVPFSHRLSVPGEVPLPEVAGRISARVTDLPGGRLEAWPPAADVAVVAEAALAEPLTVRNRRPGDVFRPLGLGGRKKLQDYFVDRKVAREVRDRVPLVVDARGRIVWVVGHAIGEEFRVTDPTKSVVILQLEGLGGVL